MAWDLRGNMQEEIDRSLMTSRFTPGADRQLYPAYPYKRNRPIVERRRGRPRAPRSLAQGPRAARRTPPPAGTGAHHGAGLQSQLSSLSKTLDKVPALLGPNGNGIGSNSWVVSGTHTTTGKPLLANDPHLAPADALALVPDGPALPHRRPPCHYDVSGFTFSGMPGVVIGHNQDISWGMTNLGADVTDLYLEKVTADGYLYDGKQQPFITRKETIKVAGGESREITVRSTKNGPIVSDRDAELAGRQGRPGRQRGPGPRRRLRRRAALDRAGTPASPWTPSSSSTGPRTGTVPQGRRGTSRCPRRT